MVQKVANGTVKDVTDKLLLIKTKLSLINLNQSKKS